MLMSEIVHICCGRITNSRHSEGVRGGGGEGRKVKRHQGVRLIRGGAPQLIAPQYHAKAIYINAAGESLS